MADAQIQHLLRRAGFGSTPDELAKYSQFTYAGAVDAVINYEQVPDDVDSKIGTPGYAGITARGPFAPNTNITDARQRWLFRMVHSQRPLQEKMALFWHNHFATGYSKVAGALTGLNGTRLMAAKPSEDPAQQKGQIELFREYALGNFRDLLLAVAKDPAMLVWLDGRDNKKVKPQENFAREVMELFTMGVGFYTEPDVYAGARVFSGWNLRLTGNRDNGTGRYEFVYDGNQHETTAKTFSFPIYPDGNRTIPARPPSAGMQDGVDLIQALASNPNTARSLAKKLINFFVSELSEPAPGFVNGLADVYLGSHFNMKEVVRRLLLSLEFFDSSAYFARYAWPVEFVVRALKEVGFAGFSVNDALTPLSNMGQQLYEPPDVAGWDLGQEWFSTGAMLARMNFASTLATSQKFNLRDASRSNRQSPDALLSFFLDRLPTADLDRATLNELQDFLRSGGTWTGSDAQLLIKAPGLVHVIVGMPQYQCM